MLLMAERGDILPKPAGAIFADTRWEPPAVYRHLDWLIRQTSIPVHRVSAGDLYSDVWDGVNSGGYSFTTIPVFARGTDGKMLLGSRSCTGQYKIHPILECVKSLTGYRRGQRGIAACQWIGITTDEWMRMKPAREKYVSNRWPLIEMGFSRTNCIEWFSRHYPGQPLTKSSCVGCPFHSRQDWLRLALEEPEAMHEAILLDDYLRSPQRDGNASRYDEYLHRSGRPLRDVIEGLLKQRAENPQLPGFEPDEGSGWGNECEGMCGV